MAGEQELCDRKWEISEYFHSSKTPVCEIELGWYLDHWEARQYGSAVLCFDSDASIATAPFRKSLHL